MQRSVELLEELRKRDKTAEKFEGNTWIAYAVAVLIVAAVTLTGIALVSEYGVQLRTPTSATEDGTTVLVGTGVLVGSAEEYPYLQTVTSCINGSNSAAVSSAFYTVQEGGDNGGTITLLSTGQAFNNSAINCSLTYKADSTAQASANTFIAGLAIFGTFMVVIVLSLVGKLIINIFKKD